jgi:hypothetical protein
MRALVLLLVCALSPLAPLWTAVDAGPVSDDFYFTSRAFSLSPAALVTSTEWQHQLMPQVSGYRPLALVSYEVSRRLGGGGGGLDAERAYRVYRATNYGLHVLVTFLVGLLCLRWSGSLRAALLASIAFGLHPLHHENVVWISGRTHTLAALFTLAGLIVLISPHHRGTWRAALAMAIATAAALASYEGAVIVPAIAFVLVLGTSERGKDWKTSALTVLPAVAVAAAYLVMRMFWVSAVSNDTAMLSTGRAIRNVAGLVARLLAMPRLEHTPLVWSWPFLISAAIAIPAIAILLRDARTRMLGITAIALAFVSYLPYVLLPGYSDRFAYLASVWFAIAVAVGLDSLWRHERDHRIARPAVVLAAALLFVTWGVQLREAGRQWWTAGAIARDIRSQATTLLPAPAAGAALRFLCVPDFHGTALVYLTYFDRAIQDAYGRADLHPLRVGIGPGGIDGRASDALFWWDGAARRLQLIEPATAAARDLSCRNAAVVKP